MSAIESLCKPDSNHWCIECCEGVDCGLLDQLPDGSLGCLGHDLPEGQVKTVSTSGGTKRIYPQSPVCRTYDCLSGKSIDKEELRRKISQLPPGEFRMSKLI